MNMILQRIAVLIATGLGIGYLFRIGQGTVAALVALIFIPAFLSLTIFHQIGLIIAGIGIGVLVSHIAERRLGTKDDHRIVIDEIVSVFITFVGLGIGLPWYILVIGFVLNRLFDIWKPFPVNRFQNFPGGWGIMIDDVLAGIYAYIILRIILFF